MSVDYSHAHNRPDLDDRLFVCDFVEDVIEKIRRRIKDPDLERIFVNCLPNTLDTTVQYSEDETGVPDTYVVTGDIPALWLRDSTCQVWPYLSFIKDDNSLRKMFEGLINRQARSILKDPYANAFDRDGVFERKYELDSLCFFLRLSSGYFEKTKDNVLFDDVWLRAVNKVIEIIFIEQSTLNKENLDLLYHFRTRSGHLHPAVRINGYGYPGKNCGLSRCVFRPSDDECVFPYIIPSNAMAVVELRKISEVLESISAYEAAKMSLKLGKAIDRGIYEWGIVDHKVMGKIYAYEVDGLGSCCIMDDPNIPSLLSLPYLGYVKADDEVYVNTRKLLLSEWNGFYARGRSASGITSPHMGTFNHYWPLATIMQALTSNNEKEIRSCLKILKKTHDGTFFMHEAIDVDDPHKYSRYWFAWANSLFGELILKIDSDFPGLLNDNL